MVIGGNGDHLGSLYIQPSVGSFWLNSSTITHPKVGAIGEEPKVTYRQAYYYEIGFNTLRLYVKNRPNKMNS